MKKYVLNENACVFYNILVPWFLEDGFFVWGEFVLESWVMMFNPNADPSTHGPDSSGLSRSKCEESFETEKGKRGTFNRTW